MAHFAEIKNNIVEKVIVINNKKLEEMTEPLTIEQAKKIAILNKLGGDWVQTSYNNNFRGNYAGIGYIYMPEYDIFMPPKPFDSWVLNLEKAKWEAPIEYPKDNNDYFWNEKELNWNLYIPDQNETI